MTPAAIVVREARPEELDVVREVTWRAYSQYQRVMEARAWQGLAGAVERAFEDLPPDVRIFVAVRDDRIVGSVLLFPPDSDPYRGATPTSYAPEIRLLAVLPDERGRGIGRKLVAECIGQARAMGADAIGLHTSRSMIDAIRLYRRLGFRRFPDLDFRPPGAELVTAYRLDLV